MVQTEVLKIVAVTATCEMDNVGKKNPVIYLSKTATSFK